MFRICSKLFDLFLRLSDFVALERDRILIVFGMHVVLSNYIYKRYFSQNGIAEFQMARWSYDILTYVLICILFFLVFFFVIFLCQHPISVILVNCKSTPPPQNHPLGRKIKVYDSTRQIFCFWC